MPNKIFSSIIEEHAPKFNLDITNGLGMKMVPQAMEFIDMVIRSAMRSSTPYFQYHGYRYLSPEEEVESNLASNGSKKDYDVAGTDVKKVELKFTYDGKPLHRRYLYIPFVTDGSMMIISGAKYIIVPVLTDSVISPSEKELFVRLLRDKLIFNSVKHNFLKNNDVNISNIVYSDRLLRANNIKNMLGTKVVTPVALYIPAKMGLREMFKKYYNIENVILTNDEKEMNKLRATHNIYSSTGKKPRSMTIVNTYHHHGYSICINKKYKDNSIDDIVFQILYGFDIMPELVKNIAKNYNTGNTDKEIHLFKIMLARIIYRDGFSLDRSFDGLIDHFNNLESYIDELIKIRLHEMGIEIEDFFDFIVVLSVNFSKWIVKGKSYTNNIYNRYIDILYYIMYDIIVGINKLISDITKNTNKRILDVNKIGKIMNMNLSPKAIYKISKAKGMNIALLSARAISDSKYLTMTAVLELQERGLGVLRSSQNKFPANTRTLTGPDLFLGSLLFLPKHVATPKVRINPFLKLDMTTGRIAPDKETKETLDLLDNLFNNKEEINDDVKKSMELSESAEED